MKLILSLAVFFCACTFIACNDQETKSTAEENKDVNKTPVIQEENITYSADTVNMNGFLAWDSASTKKRPAILVVHEWWGLNDYTKGRAKQLAAMGYVALALDMYGNGKTADNPELAGKMAMPFYNDPKMTKARFDAALAKLKTHPMVDTSKIAAIGYCFGGSVVLNVAKLGDELDGVVSFHGGLAGVPANKDLLKSKVLVCHGTDDSFVKPEEVAMFRKQMDSIGADYSFKTYPGATHAFSNPNATETGKKFNIPIAYNAAADTASWKDMQDFFGRIFK